MGYKLVFLYFLVISSALVDSFPYPEGNREYGEYQTGIRQNDPIFALRQNVNPLWPRYQGIPQSTQSPNFVWNHNNYKNPEKQQIDNSNFARPVNAYGYGQPINSYDNVTPVTTLQNEYYPQWSTALIPQHSTPAPTSNVYSEGWWNSQRLNQPQQSQFYGRPHEANSFVQNYAKPYVNQGHYDQRYSHYQSAGPMTPKPLNNFNSYRQEWLPQNQYNYISTPSPVEYQWLVPDNEKAQPIDFNLAEMNLNEPNIPPENNPREDLGINSPEPVQPDDQEPIVASQQLVNNQTIIPKHYIIVHMNGTYEHVDNLDDIVIDEFNIAHIKSKDAPNHVYAIIEIEETNEMESQTSLEVPLDTGITKIPRDSDWNTNDHDHPGTHQNYKYPITQATTENTTYDMQYFKPEFIMPIQSTTENIIESTTKISPQTTTINDNIDTIKNRFAMQSTTEHTDISTTDNYTASATISATDSTAVSTTDSTTVSTIDSTTNIVVATSTDSSQHSTAYTNDEKQDYLFTTQTTEILQRAKNFNNYYDYEENDYYEESKHNTPNTKSLTSEQNSRIDKDIKGKNFDGFDTIQSSDLPKWTFNKRGNEYNKPAAYYDEAKQTINDNNADYEQTDESMPTSASSDTYETKRDLENESYQDKSDRAIPREQTKLREDLKIDVSELKTVVDKPVFWFRPDENFWDKVTKGEQAFDAVSIYDVHCKPKLIERLTTIHHYANGTEVVDYVETIWDSLDAINPREIRSKREFREP